MFSDFDEIFRNFVFMCIRTPQSFSCSLQYYPGAQIEAGCFLRGTYLMTRYTSQWSSVRRCIPLVASEELLIYKRFFLTKSKIQCSLFAWIEGFPTFSISTNPVKALDVLFSSSQFCKQHPWSEESVIRTYHAFSEYAWPCENLWGGR